MTSIRIVPKISDKTARVFGLPSAGEHVDVRIVGCAELLPSETLRLRVKFGPVTIAVFPTPESTDAWGADGDDLTCHLNMNTIQAKMACHAGTIMCRVVLDQPGNEEHTVEPTLFFDDCIDVSAWHQESGKDVPYDLGRYPDQIADLNNRINEIGGKVDEAKNAAQAAQGSANASYEAAQSAVAAAQEANGRANQASQSASSASADARRAEAALSEINTQVEEASQSAASARESAEVAGSNSASAAASAAVAENKAIDAAADAENAVTTVDAHIGDKTNPHFVTKAQVGLGSVDNTSDMNKPVSHPQRRALDEKQDILTKSQFDAVNSGINAEKVSQISSNAADISAERTRAQMVEATKADIVGGKVPASQLPSYVDDVLEFDSASAFPSVGESGKIYIAKDTNIQYRWSGTRYVQLGGGGVGEDTNAVHYYSETRTEEDKAQARKNIGARGLTDFDVMGDIEVVPSGDPVEADFPSIKWYVTESRLGDFTLEWNASDGVWIGLSEGGSATIMLEDGVFQFYSVFGPAYVGGYPQTPTQYETSYSETFVLSVKKSASGKVGSIARTSATGGIAKLGSDGVLTAATKSSDVGEDGDYRDPTDNVCRAESSKFVATGAPHGFNDEPIYDPLVGILWTDDAGGVWCAIQPITDVNFTFYAYGGGAEGQFTATRQRVASKGETFVTSDNVHSKGVCDDGSPADQELHDFFTESNGALTETIDDRLPIPISVKSAGFTTESYKRFVVTVSGDMTVTLHTPTGDDAEIFECRFNGSSLAADASITFAGATATTMDTDCGTVTAGKVALMSAFWNGTTWDVNWKVEG